MDLDLTLTDLDGDTITLDSSEHESGLSIRTVDASDGEVAEVALSRRQVLEVYEFLGAHLAATALDAEQVQPGHDSDCAGCLEWEQAPPALADGPEHVTILEDAQAAVYGDRQQDYDHPRQNFTQTAILWHGVLMRKLADGESITPQDVALCMVQVKVSRETHRPKRDNRVDGAGYFECLDRLETGR